MDQTNPTPTLQRTGPPRQEGQHGPGQSCNAQALLDRRAQLEKASHASTLHRSSTGGLTAEKPSHTPNLHLPLAQPAPLHSS